MKTSTWLSGAAFVALLVGSSIAQAGQLFKATMNGAGVVPPNTSMSTGNAYFILNSGNTTGTFFVTHNFVNTKGLVQVWSGTTGQASTTLLYSFIETPRGPNQPRLDLDLNGFGLLEKHVS